MADENIADKIKEFESYVNTVLEVKELETLLLAIVTHNVEKKNLDNIIATFRTFFKAVKNFNDKSKKLERLDNIKDVPFFYNIKNEFYNDFKYNNFFHFAYTIFKEVATKKDDTPSCNANLEIVLSSNFNPVLFIEMCSNFIIKIDNVYMQRYSDYIAATTTEKLNQMTLLVEEAKKNTEQTEILLTKAGISSFSKDYDKIAINENSAKLLWLLVTIGFGGTALYLAQDALSISLISGEYKDILLSLPRTIIFIVAALWTSHKYSIARRNHLVYRHLASTLSTFNAFDKTVKGEHRSLLLFEMAKVLFPPPLNNRTENQRELGNMIDLLKTISSQNIFYGNKSSSNDNTPK